MSPRAPAAEQRANFTIASSGWLLMLSGLWTLLTITAPVPILGGLHGILAVLYNLTFGGLFAAMGYALVKRQPWALPVTFATSLVYSIDKLAFVLDDEAQAAAFGEAGAMLGELAPVLTQVTILVSLAFLAGWWGFVLFLYVKRDYFEPGVAPESGRP